MSETYDSGFGEFYSRYWGNVATVFGKVLPRLWKARSGASSRFLDVGCGSGELVQAMAGAGFEATGVDLSSALLEHAKKRCAKEIDAGKVVLQLADMSEMELSGSFGIVASTYYVLNHVPSDVLDKTLQRIATHTEPDGLLVFQMRSMGQLESTDGELSVKREHGGIIVRRYLRIADGEYMMFHTGYYRDETSTLREIEFRVRLFGYSVADLRQRLSAHGMTHVVALDVSAPDLPSGSDEKVSIRKLELASGDSAKELVLLVSRSAETIASASRALGVGA